MTRIDQKVQNLTQYLNISKHQITDLSFKQELSEVFMFSHL